MAAVLRLFGFCFAWHRHSGRLATSAALREKQCSRQAVAMPVDHLFVPGSGDGSMSRSV
jgi:hypothetical protein